jgi:hypothetical protein
MRRPARGVNAGAWPLVAPRGSVPIGSIGRGAGHLTASGAAAGRWRLRWRIAAQVRAAFQSMVERHRA